MRFDKKDGFQPLDCLDSTHISFSSRHTMWSPSERTKNSLHAIDVDRSFDVEWKTFMEFVFSKNSNNFFWSESSSEAYPNLFSYKFLRLYIIGCFTISLASAWLLCVPKKLQFNLAFGSI